MDLFGSDDALRELEARPAAAQGSQQAQHLVALAWHLRQRDPQRATRLSEEVQALVPTLALPTPPAQCLLARLQLVLSEVRLLDGEVDAARALAQQALQTLVEHGQGWEVGDARLSLSVCTRFLGSRDEADRLLAQAHADYQAAGDAQRSAIALLFEVLEQALRDTAGAQQRLLHSGLLGAEQPLAVRAYVEFTQGVLLLQSGDYAGGVRHSVAAFGMLPMIGSVRGAVAAASNAGHGFDCLNDPETALSWQEQALGLARRIGRKLVLGMALNNAARAMVTAGRHEAALGLLAEAEALFPERARGRAMNASLQGQANLALGHHQAAIASFERAEARLQELGDFNEVLGAQRGRVQALLALGLLAQARDLCAAALQQACDKSLLKTQSELLLLLARVRRAQHGDDRCDDVIVPMEQALRIAGGIDGYQAPVDLLESLAAEHVRVRKYRRAYTLMVQAGQAREKINGRAAANRAIAMHVGQDVERLRLEAEHLRALHEADLLRADALMTAMEAAQEATRLKSMFLAVASHEIRTPLNAVVGLSRLALKSPLPQPQAEYLDSIHRAATSLQRLINDILDFSKIEAGQMSVEAVDFELDDVLDHAAAMVAQASADRPVEVVFDIAADVPHRLRGDPMRLGQVFNNLLNNAMKFTDHGEIVLGVRCLRSTASTHVLAVQLRDTGIGMTPEQQQRLFTAFTQADASIGRRFGGTGLGLIIAKRLVELMGGSISVSSQLGQGTCFSFDLQLGMAETAAAEPDAAAPLAGRRALLVQPHAGARRAAAQCLCRLGLAVDEADDAEQALADVMQGRIDADVVLLDARLHDAPAQAAVRRLLAWRGPQRRPALVRLAPLAATAADEAAPQLDAHLGKPFSARMACTLLRRLFGDDALERAKAAHAQHRLQGMQVLVVEDGPVNRIIASELLSGAGATVTLAGDGVEALERLSNKDAAYAAILMDLQMPVMDGLEATRRIRTDARWQRVPIIGISASDTAEMRRQCVEAGMVGHVDKPFEPAQLIRSIAQWVDQARQA